jgi:hypothetical protein
MHIPAAYGAERSGARGMRRLPRPHLRPNAWIGRRPRGTGKCCRSNCTSPANSSGLRSTANLSATPSHRVHSMPMKAPQRCDVAPLRGRACLSRQPPQKQSSHCVSTRCIFGPPPGPKPHVCRNSREHQAVVKLNSCPDGQPLRARLAPDGVSLRISYTLSRFAHLHARTAQSF